MVIFIIIWASWLISEIILSRFFRARSTNTKGWDKSSLTIMWVTICISIYLGVIMMRFTHFAISRSYLIAYLGLILIISGIAIRIAAIRTLGSFFTVNLAIHNDHQLITNGLYKSIRHPSYTGSLLSFIGLGVTFNNWLSLAVIVIPIIVSFIYRINVEEQLMLKQFGSEYIAYKKNTKRLIPLIY
jgi:protein-S-isoprenylcysteine O-methyltransferase Ste14